MTTPRTTYIVPLRIEHPDRLNNARITMRYLSERTSSKIIILENGPQSHQEEIIGELARKEEITYVFQKTDHPIFWRTKIINDGLELVTTPVVVIFDVDVLIPLESLKEAERKILNDGLVMCYPFGSGEFVPFGEDSKDLSVYYVEKEHHDKVDFDDLTKLDPHCRRGFGGYGFVLFFSTDYYRSLGGENVHFVSYAPEDRERPKRIDALGQKRGSVKGSIYHLEHYRDLNGSGRNPFFKQNVALFDYLSSLTGEEVAKYYRGQTDGKMVTYSTLGANGRLGNQLFQLAFIVNLASMTCRDAVIGDWEYSKYFEENALFTKRPPPETVWVRHRTKEYSYVETELVALDRFSNWDFGGEGDSYYQSWKHFFASNDRIQKLFTLKKEYSDAIHADIPELGNPELGMTISIHARRTDFATSPPHLLLDLQYYDSALFKMKEALVKKGVLQTNPTDGTSERITFVLASDDRIWLGKNIPGLIYKHFFADNRVITLKVLSNKVDILDLFSLSYCDHLITSNSTFSLWSAILNAREDRTVICPKNFYAGNSKLSSEHLPPPTAIVVRNNNVKFTSSILELFA